MKLKHSTQQHVKDEDANSTKKRKINPLSDNDDTNHIKTDTDTDTDTETDTNDNRHDEEEKNS